MAAPEPQTLSQDVRPDAGDQCPACAHRRSDHDALGTRFCAATIVAGLTRGCICR